MAKDIRPAIFTFITCFIFTSGFSQAINDTINTEQADSIIRHLASDKLKDLVMT